MHKKLTLLVLFLVKEPIDLNAFDDQLYHVKFFCHNAPVPFEAYYCCPQEIAQQISLDPERLKRYRCSQIGVYSPEDQLEQYFDSTLQFLIKYTAFEKLSEKKQALAKINIIKECLKRPFDVNDPYDTQYNKALATVYDFMQHLLSSSAPMSLLDARAIIHELKKISGPSLYADNEEKYKALLYAGLTAQSSKTDMSLEPAQDILAGLQAQTLTLEEKDLARGALKRIYPG